MYEAKRFGVEGLTRTDFEAVLHKLSVLCCRGASDYFVAAVASVVEERVSDMLHVHTYLVRASCFELALHHCYVAEVFDNLVVGDGVFALVAFGEDSHLQAVFRIAADVAFHSSVVFSEFTPDQRHVLAMGCLVEELLAEKSLGIWCFGNDKQSRCVFVDAVHESEPRVADVVVGVVAEW